MEVAVEQLDSHVGEATEEVVEELPEMATAPVMAAETPNSCVMVSKRETRWQWTADDGDGWLDDADTWLMMKVMMDRYG